MTPGDALFLGVVALLITHELDAIHQHEWRFFFFLKPFSDENAYRIFTAAHVPLLLLIFLNLPVSGFQIGLDVFVIGHALLHAVLRHHPRLTFNHWLSRVWIFGAAALAVVHLLVR